ncbi:hypothetical protein [Kamptonema formosum]|uniref:hypothetical protein n=1 Tax=Kamptonema formosum TaxID=331992 RepID=UPI0012DC1817|nr:hypothetical protein [Oscillatoria sp. PCC 10802]
MNQLFISLPSGYFQPAFYVAAKIFVMDLGRLFLERKTRGGIGSVFHLGAGWTSQGALPERSKELRDGNVSGIAQSAMAPPSFAGGIPLARF